jgi:solute carrier family 9B (sodium/hydrogen exchanger), member 1/2
VLAPAAPAALALVALVAAGWGWRSAGRALGIPPAVSLMVLGAAAGPSGLGAVPADYLATAPVLSKAAFTLLLLRAGLALDPATLHAVVRTGAILGTVPVAVELGVVAAISRLMLFARWDLAILAGFLIAAVSPAVVLPTMLAVKERGLGRARHVPDRAMAQTIVNAFVAQTGIVLLLRGISPGDGGTGALTGLVLLPAALLGGVGAGVLLGHALPRRAARNADGSRAGALPRTVAIAALGAAAYFGGAALQLENVFATVAVGAVVRRRLQAGGADLSEPHRKHLNAAWQVAEIVLFVNLGAAVDLRQLGGGIVLVGLGIIAAALGARVITVAALLKRSRLTARERTYLALAHLPKATIQAVFGVVPLAAFVRHGQVHLQSEGQAMLILSVLAIVATAPIGALLLERTAVRFLGPSAGSPREGIARSGAIP